MATTGSVDAFTSCTIVSNRPVSGRDRPVPNRASTTRSQAETSEACSSHSCSLPISTRVWPRRPRMSRLMRASPLTSAARPTRNTATSWPAWSSVRATTNPSPPLLPGPHSTAMRLSARSSTRSSSVATTCRPAHSISTSDPMPMSSMVMRSASRICAALSTRMAPECYHCGARPGPRAGVANRVQPGRLPRRRATRYDRRQCPPWSTSTGASPASATPSSRSSITGSCSAKASTR